MAHAVVLGASGGIGQPLSLLLKTNPRVAKVFMFFRVASIDAEEIL
jgi:malate/lactate dehydrogenase